MADSPVEFSPVQFCVSIRVTVQSSPVESSFVSGYSEVHSSPVESRFVNIAIMVQFIVKSSGIQWNPVESMWIMWEVVKYWFL